MHKCEWNGRRCPCEEPGKYLLQLYHTYLDKSESKGSLIWFCEECWVLARVHYIRCGIRWEF